MKRLTGFGLVGLLFLASCASSDEAIAEKDRKLQERAGENESLARQNADLKSTNLVMQTEIEAKNKELTAKDTMPPPPCAKPAAMEPTNVGTKSHVAHAAPKSMKVEVTDQDVHCDTRPDGSCLVRIAGGATFASGSATLTKRGKEALKKIGDELKHTKGSIRIEGHTDATPLTGKNKETYGNNRNLSIARALAVEDFLVKDCKVPKTQIEETVGLGDAKPVDSAKNKAAYAKNRRIDIIVKGA
jgi:flagellar motor protein MotB